MSRYIDEHRGRFGVEPICRVLDVSASAYYHRATGARSARQIENQRLLEVIRRWGQQKPAVLTGIHQPVLVMNGESDRMVPTKNTIDLDRRLPNSQLVVYPDAGHGGVFQFHEDFVKRALEFL